MDDKADGPHGKAGTSRRNFLWLAGSSAPAAAAALIGGSVSAETVDPPSSLGLRKTEHVKKYLDSARF